MAEIEKDERDRWQGDGGVNKATAQKNTEAICQVTQWFGQERIDLPLADIGGDLPLVLGWRDQIADEDGEQVIIEHRAVIVAV